jgi:hypothetical protein
MKYIWRKIKRFKRLSPCGWHNGAPCTQMCISGVPITQNGLPQETTQLLWEPPHVLCKPCNKYFLWDQYTCICMQLAKLSGHCWSVMFLVKKRGETHMPTGLSTSLPHSTCTYCFVSARLAFQSRTPPSGRLHNIVLIH